MQLASSLKQMRIIHVVLTVVIVLYAYSAELVTGRNGSGVSAGMLYGMVVISGIDALIAYYFRRTKLLPGLEKLRINANDSEALKQWRLWTILSMVFALSIALYGFALRFLGASRRVSWLFYAAALILMFMWRPQLDVATGASSARENQ